MSLASLSICNDEHYLQQEPWAFGHEREGHHRGGTGERADDDKHTPTVELVGWPHAEAPPWERKMGGVRGSEDPAPLWASTPGTWNGQLFPPPEDWADLGISHSDQLNLKMANNSAEKKDACNQSQLGLGMEVHVYFWTSKLQRPRSMNLGQCFLQQTPGLGIPCLLLQITLDPCLCCEPGTSPPWATPTGCLVHRLPAGLEEGSTGRRTERGIRVQGIYSPSLPSPLPLVAWRFDSGCAHPWEPSHGTTSLVRFWQSHSPPDLWGTSEYRRPFGY